MEVVIRNHLGLALASMVDKVPPLSSIEAVESLVAVHAFRLASDCGFPSIILEGDLEIVNNALRSEEESFTSFGHLIAEARTIVETFYAVTLSHTRGQGNSVHNLARHASHVSGFTV